MPDDPPILEYRTPPAPKPSPPLPAGWWIVPVVCGATAAVPPAFCDHLLLVVMILAMGLGVGFMTSLHAQGRYLLCGMVGCSTATIATATLLGLKEWSSPGQPAPLILWVAVIIILAFMIFFAGLIGIALGIAYQFLIRRNK